MVSAEYCRRIPQRNRKLQRVVVENRITRDLIEKLCKVSPYGPGEQEVTAAWQQLDKPKNIGAMLSYVSGIDVFAIRLASGKIEKSARLERDQDLFVDQTDVVADATHVLERFEIVIIQENCRKADHLLFDSYR